MFLQEVFQALTLSQRVTALQTPSCCHGGPSCSCGGGGASVITNLKLCAGCGAASYGSKECQRKDWKSHKAVCLQLRQYKHYITQLERPMQKQALARSLSLEVPLVHEEYKRRYGESPVVDFLSEVRRMVVKRSRNNLKDLFASDEGDMEQMVWRWQEVSPNLIEFLHTASPGDIFKKKKYRPYTPGAPQQFRNTPLALGGLFNNDKPYNFIDIGFVDLGIVFDSLDSLDADGCPVTIVGIDAEPFCVAKALVMFEMAKDPSIVPRSVVEVWFSSFWSEVTHKSFLAAVKKVLEDQVSGTQDERVMNILQFWKDCPKMKAVKSEIFQTGNALMKRDIRFCTRACNLSEERDRAEYIRYHFTKALYEDASCTLGSPVMSTVEESLGIKQICENVFEAVPFGVHSWTDPRFKKNASLMERCRSYFETQMKRYMDLVQNGIIQFVPRVGEVSSKNSVLLSELAKLDAYVVSWSNVVDYIPVKDFHEMAQQISGDNTMHYFHTINWCTRTCGVDIYDIPQDIRLQVFSEGLALREQLTCAYDGFKSNGPFHFRNICSPVLARQFINAFLRYLFAGQDVNCCGFFDQGSPLGFMNPLGRTDTTAFLAFAYKDTGIHFPQNAYDFTKD